MTPSRMSALTVRFRRADRLTSTGNGVGASARLGSGVVTDDFEDGLAVPLQFGRTDPRELPEFIE